MLGRRKKAHMQGEHAIFGDEEAAQLRSDLDHLRTDIAELNTRIHSQFTTIAAHAEIARDQADLARQEARADLERTRETLIGLIEQVRMDSQQAAGHHIPGTAPGPSVAAHLDRLDQVETTMASVTDTVDRCYARQEELADTMAAFLDTMLAEQRGEPIAGLSLA